MNRNTYVIRVKAYFLNLVALFSYSFIEIIKSEGNMPNHVTNQNTCLQLHDQYLLVSKKPKAKIIEHELSKNNCLIGSFKGINYTNKCCIKSMFLEFSKGSRVLSHSLSCRFHGPFVFTNHTCNMWEIRTVVYIGFKSSHLDSNKFFCKSK
jgi:hypothetical protein